MLSEDFGKEMNMRSKYYTIIDWDNPTDPGNPVNWKSKTKLIHVFLIGGFSLY